jgi:hypothetical protein
MDDVLTILLEPPTRDPAKRSSNVTRYEQLANLATDQAARRRHERNRCAQFAWRLMRGLADYLECPLGTASFAWLGPDFRLGETQGSVRDSRPRMQLGEDGFWYFAIRLHFQAPADDSISYDFDGCYGLKEDGAAFVVRGDEDVRIDPTDMGAIGSFYEETYRELGEALSKPFTDPPRRFGFAPPEPDPIVVASSARNTPLATRGFPQCSPGTQASRPSTFCQEASLGRLP